MRRALLTLIATVVALLVTLLCRPYVLTAFAGQSSNSLFAPWVLWEAGVVLLVALSLFLVVWNWTKTCVLLISSAIAYVVCTLPTSAMWLEHPDSLGDAVAMYTAVFLPQIAVAVAFLMVFFYSKSQRAKP